jgi:hypothetical protein
MKLHKLGADMNQLALWSTALSIVALGSTSFAEEFLDNAPAPELLVSAFFVLLSILAAVGLVCRVQIARASVCFVSVMRFRCGLSDRCARCRVVCE